MVLPLTTLAPFSPVNPVTPFTYRDNATFLTILHALERRVNEIIAAVNLANDQDATNLNEAILELTNSLNLTVQNVYTELTAMIDGSHDESVATDPTNGNRLSGLSTVISNVYDNARIFAYFAQQYDELLLTASAYDALEYSARHFDLGITYPILNDVQGL